MANERSSAAGAARDIADALRRVRALTSHARASVPDLWAVLVELGAIGTELPALLDHLAVELEIADRTHAAAPEVRAALRLASDHCVQAGMALEGASARLAGRTASTANH